MYAPCRVDRIDDFLRILQEEKEEEENRTCDSAIRSTSGAPRGATELSEED